MKKRKFTGLRKRAKYYLMKDKKYRREMRKGAHACYPYAVIGYGQYVPYAFTARPKIKGTYKMYVPVDPNRLQYNDSHLKQLLP